MKIGYSQADVAKAYYDKVKPGNDYDNRKANNQFCQDKNLDWYAITEIIIAMNEKSLSDAVKLRAKYRKEIFKLKK